MKVLTLAMLTGSGIAALATAFIFSCCVLPFHREIHSVVPLCHIAQALSPDVGDTSENPARPAEKKQDDQKSIATFASTVNASYAIASDGLSTTVRGSVLHRGRRSHGAMRCDQDVGLLTLLSVSRI